MPEFVLRIAGGCRRTIGKRVRSASPHDQHVIKPGAILSLPENLGPECRYIFALRQPAAFIEVPGVFH
jgi:hypothetical protein